MLYGDFRSEEKNDVIEKSNRSQVVSSRRGTTSEELLDRKAGEITWRKKGKNWGRKNKFRKCFAWGNLFIKKWKITFTDRSFIIRVGKQDQNINLHLVIKNLATNLWRTHPISTNIKIVIINPEY